VHLILNGIVGLLLGWGAVPAIVVALVLQAVLFQYGGITTLGINTVIMAGPAVICYLVFAPIISKKNRFSHLGAFAVGFFSVLLGAITVGLALMFTEKNFFEVAALVVAAHIPVMIIEGFITVFCVSFLKKVHPSLLPG